MSNISIQVFTHPTYLRIDCTMDTMALTPEMLENIFTDLRASRRKNREEEHCHLADPFAVGRWVVLRGSKREEFNGCIGMITENINENGCVGVRIQHVGHKLVRAHNLQPFAEEELVKITRCSADGEGSCISSSAYAGVRTWLWPRCALENLAHEISPVSCRIGIPLCVAKMEPSCGLKERRQWDNQLATYLMIDAGTGFAPDRWQSFVGPIAVWRESFQPFSSDDFWLVHNFLCDLLDKYAEGTMRLGRDVTPEAFGQSKQMRLDFEQQNPEDVDQSEDVNI